MYTKDNWIILDCAANNHIGIMILKWFGESMRDCRSNSIDDFIKSVMDALSDAHVKYLERYHNKRYNLTGLDSILLQ